MLNQLCALADKCAFLLVMLQCRIHKMAAVHNSNLNCAVGFHALHRFSLRCIKHRLRPCASHLIFCAIYRFQFVLWIGSAYCGPIWRITCKNFQYPLWNARLLIFAFLHITYTQHNFFTGFTVIRLDGPCSMSTGRAVDCIFSYLFFFLCAVTLLPIQMRCDIFSSFILFLFLIFFLSNFSLPRF